MHTDNAKAALSIVKRQAAIAEYESALRRAIRAVYTTIAIYAFCGLAIYFLPPFLPVSPAIALLALLLCIACTIPAIASLIRLHRSEINARQ